VGGVNARAIIPVLCAKQLFGVSHPSRATDGAVVVLGDPAATSVPLFGLRVDDVLSIVEVAPEDVQRAGALRGHSPLLSSLIRVRSLQEGGGSVLIQLVDPDALRARVFGAAGACLRAGRAPVC